MEKFKKESIFKFLYIVCAILFVIPSINYLIQHKTVFAFDEWFKFLLDNSNRQDQTILYIFVLSLITILYVLIIKYRKKLFKNIKQILLYTGIIGLIYLIAIPFTSSDVFYYMGVGRIDSNYGQNPYYTTIKEYVNENKDNNLEIKKDTALLQGYINDWSDTTVVYGPVWQLICKGLSIFSFGKVDIGLLVFKIANLIVHLLNCYLIYKITGKKAFALIYGLNPFILIEALACVHNDIFVILFILSSLYFMLKKKKLVISMAFLALATGIKYFSVLLVPFILIYYFRREKPLKRFLNCMKYGFVFLIFLILPYLLYIKDAAILNCMIAQQDKLAKSIYIPITEFFSNISISNLNKLLLATFVIAYFFTCLTLLFKKKLNFRELIQKYSIFLVIFLFVLITQFEPWYLMWLIPVFMWQKTSVLKLFVSIGIIAEFANSVFLLNGEGYNNGTAFVMVLYTLILLFALIVGICTRRRRIRCYKNRLLKEGKI